MADRKYRIEGEELTLGEVIRKCEALAKQDGRRYFVGREAIRGRLRCGVRTWDGLTARVQSASERTRRHHWRKEPAF